MPEPLAGSSPFPTSTTTGAKAGTSGSGAAVSGGSGLSGSTVTPSMTDESADAGRVQRMANAAHEGVDKIAQTLGSSHERVMGWQQEYGDMAREQVRDNPLAAIGVAFAVGIVFSKLFMR